MTSNQPNTPYVGSYQETESFLEWYAEYGKAERYKDYSLWDKLGIYRGTHAWADGYLEYNGYEGISEWALDSDYEYNQELDVWLDEYCNVVDPYQQFFSAIESELSDQEGN